MTIDAKVIECMLFIVDKTSIPTRHNLKVREGVSGTEIRHRGFENIAKILVEEGYLNLSNKKAYEVFHAKDENSYTITEKGKEYISDILQYASEKYKK